VQQTSALYKEIWANPNHWSEVKVNINGVDYDEHSLMAVRIKSDAFSANTLTIGAAPVASCHVDLISDTMTGNDLSGLIPAGAKIVIYERLHGITSGQTEQVSEWLVQGNFYVDYRENMAGAGQLGLDGLDALAKADAAYPAVEHEWPYVDINVVREIANEIGVELDPVTVSVMWRGYYVAIPTDYTMREVLGHIAAMYAGNFIITKDEKLLLLQISSLPAESNLLITNAGDFIKVGGDRIIV
jgi:hypothetical protein